MDWKELIPACFGENDRLFAVHPLDARRALNLLVTAKEQGVSGDEFFEAFNEHLTHLGVDIEHFDAQKKRIYAHYSAWF